MPKHRNPNQKQNDSASNQTPPQPQQKQNDSEASKKSPPAPQPRPKSNDSGDAPPPHPQQSQLQQAQGSDSQQEADNGTHSMSQSTTTVIQHSNDEQMNNINVGTTALSMSVPLSNQSGVSQSPSVDDSRRATTPTCKDTKILHKANNGEDDDDDQGNNSNNTSNTSNNNTSNTTNSNTSNTRNNSNRSNNSNTNNNNNNSNSNNNTQQQQQQAPPPETSYQKFKRFGLDDEKKSITDHLFKVCCDWTTEDLNVHQFLQFDYTNPFLVNRYKYDLFPDKHDKTPDKLTRMRFALDLNHLMPEVPTDISSKWWNEVIKFEMEKCIKEGEDPVDTFMDIVEHWAKSNWLICLEFCKYFILKHKANEDICKNNKSPDLFWMNTFCKQYYFPDGLPTNNDSDRQRHADFLNRAAGNKLYHISYIMFSVLRLQWIVGNTGGRKYGDAHKSDSSYLFKIIPTQKQNDTDKMLFSLTNTKFTIKHKNMNTKT